MAFADAEPPQTPRCAAFMADHIEHQIIDIFSKCRRIKRACHCPPLGLERRGSRQPLRKTTADASAGNSRAKGWVATEKTKAASDKTRGWPFT